MNFSSARMTQPAWKGETNRDPQRLETLDTDPRIAYVSPTAHGLSRLAAPALLSCLLYGLTAVSVKAEESPKPADPAPVVNTAAPVTNSTAKTRTGKLLRSGGQDKPTLRLASLKIGGRAYKGQDAKPVEKAAEAPAGPAPGTVTFSGLVDVYFSLNPRAPSSASGGPAGAIITPSGETISVDNTARFFDINDRDPSVSLLELNISRTPGKGFPLGITATFTVGDSARLFHATEPGGTSSWQTLHNLYLTYTTPKFLGREIAIDFGKWASPFGMEVLESPNNDNYSRAFNFWYGVPFYHTGFRATAPLWRNNTLQLALVNGWNNVADDNNAKSVYFQLTLKPNPRFTQTLSYIGGLEGTGAYGTIAPTNGGGGVTTNLLDLTSTYQINDKLKLGGWISYGNGAGNIQGFGKFSGNWLGLVAYAKYNVGKTSAVAARIEQFEDYPGVGGIGPRFQLAGYRKFREFTLTYEHQFLKGALIGRLEYRHDHSNQQDFVAANGHLGNDQDTFSVSAAYKF